jgi:hypothetical protein
MIYVVTHGQATVKEWVCYEAKARGVIALGLIGT